MFQQVLQKKMFGQVAYKPGESHNKNGQLIKSDVLQKLFPNRILNTFQRSKLYTYLEIQCSI